VGGELNQETAALLDDEWVIDDVFSYCLSTINC
jgi:hypothetical protein